MASESDWETLINNDNRNSSSTNDDDYNNDNNNDNDKQDGCAKRSAWAWLWWGFESLHRHRKPLLLCAFGLNLIAIVCMFLATMAIATTPRLAKVGWASATATVSNLVECDGAGVSAGVSAGSATNIIDDASISIQVWLGLQGYYGQCSGKLRTNENNENDSQNILASSSTLHQHSDTFCSTRKNVTLLIEKEVIGYVWDEDDDDEDDDDDNSSLDDKEEEEIEREDHAICAATNNNDLHCELLTGVGEDYFFDDDNNNNKEGYEFNKYCSACKDTSRNCVGTLVSATAFGIFPLVLTIRRYCSTKQEQGLRLRTLFFSGLAIVLGLHSFVRFHWECVQTMPSAFSALVCSKSCNGARPFLVSVPMANLSLFWGARLVIVAAVFKTFYFVLHLVTPVASDFYQTIPTVGARTVRN